MAAVHLQSVAFTYPGSREPTLHDLDLTIDDGSTHALLGASGAGKTTLLNLLCGLLHPTDGRILFGDRDVSALGARARNVALVFQFPVLYETKSVLDNLLFPLLNRGWSVGDARARAREIAGELEIADILERRPAALSLFQKQLTAIAKSLVRTDVDLVLLDEPLTAVEPAMKWRLRKTLTRFQERHGLTMVYVTHDQTEALTVASRVSVLANGRILQTGTPLEIYNEPVNTFVGDFIGSPGMRFTTGTVRDGQIDVPGIEFDPPLEFDPLKVAGPATLGLRAQWLTPRPASGGAWTVTGIQLRGTRRGEALSLLTLNRDRVELMAEACGTWRIGDRVSLLAQRCAILEDAADAG